MWFIYRKNDGAVLITISFLKNPSTFLETFAASNGVPSSSLGMIEVTDSDIIQKTKDHEIHVENGKIVFGAIKHNPNNEPESPTEIEQLSTEVKEIKTYLSTATTKYDALDKVKTALEELKSARILKLKEECSNAIYEGFYSNGFEFSFNEQDQANFTQQLLVIIAGQTTDVYWKTRNLGVQSFNVATFQQIVTDAKNHKVTNQARYWQLEEEILAAKSNEAVDSIIW